MSIRARRLAPFAAIAAAAALGLAACSPGSGNSSSTAGSGEGSSGAGGGETTTVTFRLWDEAAAAAYKTSFEAFSAENKDIKVDVETVPWADYWKQLPTDFQAGTMADIFWTNTSNFGIYADQGKLVDITKTLGEDHDKWNQDVVDLYTRDGKLWGVPQLSDSLALFYNKSLVEAAGIDPATLKWDPSGAGDTFLPAAEKLTTDSAGKHPGEDGFNATDPNMVWGFNAQADLQAIWLPWLAQNGGTFQTGDDYSFDSPEGVGAFQYLVDLINTKHVAPPAADTNSNGDLSRDLFVQGKMALFQSGQYALPAVSEADFEWGLAPIVEGPKGRIGVVHGVAALGNADSKHPEAVTKVLAWLGSAKGQEALGATGAAFPAALDAQKSFTDYWTAKGVDTAEFAKAAAGENTAAPLGPRSNAGLNAIGEVFPEMFAAQVPVADALKQAQDGANEAVAGD